jgi:hypothetical protein
VYTTLETRRAHAEGRAEQYLEMIQVITTLESKYGGVRGALLKKVRDELEKLKPLAAEGRSTTSSSSSPARQSSSAASQRCDACGREMKMNGTDGRFVCMNGHVR